MKGRLRAEFQVGGILYDRELKNAFAAIIDRCPDANVPVLLDGQTIGRADRFRYQRRGGWFTGRARLDIPKTVASRLRSKQLKGLTYACKRRKILLRVELNEAKP